MNYISLFSSAGVGCYGFKEEKFIGVATSELIERRLNVQKANNKLKYNDGYILGDITEEEIKNKLFNSVEKFKLRENESEIDVVIFTPPCQGMSVANHKKSDGTIERNSLVVEALEIVEKIKPRFFISENVRSYMNTKCIDHDTQKTIKEAFKDHLAEEYAYIDKRINFKDYGANSSRPRTLVIGVRKDLLPIVNPEELFPSLESDKSLYKLIYKLPRLNEIGEISKSDIYHGFKSYRSDMRSWIENLKEGENSFDNDTPETRPHKIINGEIIQNVNKNSDKYKRQYWNKVAPCVHTRNDILASQNTIHPEDDRVFSIRELKIFMNVPKSFKWTSDSQKFLNNLSITDKESFMKKNEINIRQSLGEAVPTIIMQKIARNIKDVLNEVDRNENKESNKRLQPNS